MTVISGCVFYHFYCTIQLLAAFSFQTVSFIGCSCLTYSFGCVLIKEIKRYCVGRLTGLTAVIFVNVYALHVFVCDFYQTGCVLTNGLCAGLCICSSQGNGPTDLTKLPSVADLRRDLDSAFFEVKDESIIRVNNSAKTFYLFVVVFFVQSITD